MQMALPLHEFESSYYAYDIKIINIKLKLLCFMCYLYCVIYIIYYVIMLLNIMLYYISSVPLNSYLHCSSNAFGKYKPMSPLTAAATRNQNSVYLKKTFMSHADEAGTHGLFCE